ncbi:unnamed protein product [Eruca vesicaria subsp. sativa]|uniref:Uncharacterized protein n=1 Tax=Eruca vesicaria subsp. sativa TaxID=29727 RepID=A0ABC8LZ01_ERUVS|nr:unnamed protein product [Eruca vesicaria subsp. sativa]
MWLPSPPVYIKAARVEIDSYWPMVFKRMAEKRNVTDFTMNVGDGGGGCGAPVAAATSPAGGGAALPLLLRRRRNMNQQEIAMEILDLA